MTTTDDLIARLAHTPPKHARTFGRQSAALMALAVILSAMLHLGLLGPRPDLLLQLTGSAGFVFKLTVLAVLTALGLALFLGTLRPTLPRSPSRIPAVITLAAFAGLAGYVLTTTQAIAPLAYHCVLWISLFGLAPLAVLTILQKQGAPTDASRSTLALALLSWSLSAMFYALHCNADSMISAPSGHVVMLMLYFCPLPLFWLAARALRPLTLRW